MPPRNTRRYFEELDKQLKGRSPQSPEFEALLKSKIGGQFQELVTPENLEKMYLLGRPEGYNRYGGVNARAFVEAKLTPAEIATKLEKDFSSVLREGEKVPEGKTIIGIGRRANPNVFTHELRHELSFSPNKPENEIKNRFYDLIYGSTSYPAYLTNIRRVHEATLHLDPEFKRGKTDADFARRRQMSWYSSDKEKEKHVLKSPYLQELLSPGKEGVSLPSRAKNLFSDIVNKNYELNVSGVNARTENLPKDAIELRSKFPFLNFVGSPEMENALPGPKAQPKSRAEGSPRTGETSADLYRLLLESSDLSRSIPTSPPSGPPKDSKTSADLLRLIPTSPSSGAPIKQPDLREEGVGFNPDLTLGDKLVGAGLELYGRNVNREDLPLHKRIFLESVVDARKDPITEASMTEPERQALMSVVRNKYKAIELDLNTYEKYLVKSLASHQKAVATKNKDEIMYPEFFAQYKKDLDAIKQYKKGVITQDLIDLASGDSQTYESEVGLKSAGVAGVANIFNIGPNLGYEDYPIAALKNPSNPSVFGSHTPVTLNRTFGRIGYTVDPKTKQLVFQENYDFNPLPPGYKGSTEGHLAGAFEGGGDPLYRAIRLYAGKVLPPGQGRPVNVRLNQFAPPQVREGIGQLPNAPQNLPNEGRIQAILRRLGMDED